MTSLRADIITAYGKYLRTSADYLPDRREVTHIIGLLRRLVFPGCFEDSGVDMTEDALYRLIHEIENKPRRQVCRTLNIDADKSINCADMYGKADEIVSVK